MQVGFDMQKALWRPLPFNYVVYRTKQIAVINWFVYKDRYADIGKFSFDVII